MSAAHLKFFETKLNKLKASGNYRSLNDFQVSPELDFSSNDYLGLGNKVSQLTFAELKRFGSGAARLLINGSDCHNHLEDSLAQFVGTENALLFGSGYLANVGVLSSLIQRSDLVVSDKLIHGSLIDGINLSRAKHLRIRHNSVEEFETALKKIDQSRKAGQNIFMVTESVFSMDGDIAPLKELYDLSRKYQTFLIIDEAHAYGVFGEIGNGLAPSYFENDGQVILLGTLSKSFGSYGGFVCCSNVIKSFLINFARTFLFSTALPDICCLKASESLVEIKKGKSLRTELFSKIAVFNDHLNKRGIETNFISQICPIVVGSSDIAIEYADRLKTKNLKVPAIRPPTVPANKSRLRVSITRRNTSESLNLLAENISNLLAT